MMPVNGHEQLSADEQKRGKKFSTDSTPEITTEYLQQYRYRPATSRAEVLRFYGPTVWYSLCFVRQRPVTEQVRTATERLSFRTVMNSIRRRFSATLAPRYELGLINQSTNHRFSLVGAVSHKGVNRRRRWMAVSGMTFLRRPTGAGGATAALCDGGLMR